MPRKIREGVPVLLCPRAGGSRNGLITGIRDCQECGTTVEITPSAARCLQSEKPEVLCFACGRRYARGGPVEIRLLPGQEEEIREEVGLGIEDFKRASAQALLEP